MNSDEAIKYATKFVYFGFEIVLENGEWSVYRYLAHANKLEDTFDTAMEALGHAQKLFAKDNPEQ